MCAGLLRSVWCVYNVDDVVIVFCRSHRRRTRAASLRVDRTSIVLGRSRTVMFEKEKRDFGERMLVLNGTKACWVK